MDPFQQELSHLASLLSVASKQQTPSTLVSSASFQEHKQFFQVPDQASTVIETKTAPAPKKPTVYQKPPTQTILPPQPTRTPPPQQLTEETKEPMFSTSERDKKQERLLPIPCVVTPSDISKTLKELPTHLLSNKNLFQNAAKIQHWGVLTHVTNNEELTTFITSITQAITSKLTIPLSHFDKKDEQLLLRIRAASTELNILLVFGEPHSEAIVKKSFSKLYPNKLKNWNLAKPTLEIQDHRNSPGYTQGDGNGLVARDVGEGKNDSSTCLGIQGLSENPLSSYPLIHFLGTLNTMRIYFVPLTAEMKTDIQSKKKLWSSLQTLSSTP